QGRFQRHAEREVPPRRRDGETVDLDGGRPLPGGIPTVMSWPVLTLSEWADTRDTLHMWTQIVGKVRLALEPMINHWWQITLYPSARGLTTSMMPAGTRGLEI